MRVAYHPHRNEQTLVTGSTSTPPRWHPCGACGGAGGGFHHVAWSLQQQWIACVSCMGGGGMFLPNAGASP